MDDQALYAHCRTEARIPVALDLDFASVLRYPPEASGGIVVLRGPDDLLPNALSPLIVVATLDLARTIILESTLSFLGLGIQPPTPSWGGMLGEGRQYLNNAWWISIFPGVALMAVALSVSRIGDWLRDVLDPTLRS